MPLGISKKCSAIAPSATLAMDARAKALRSEGVNVIGFAAGEPDFDTPEPIREAVKEAMDKGMTRYTPVGGTLELRDAIIRRLQGGSRPYLSAGRDHCVQRRKARALQRLPNHPGPRRRGAGG